MCEVKKYILIAGVNGAGKSTLYQSLQSLQSMPRVNADEILREPYVKPIKGKNNKGLYELRIKFSSDIARIFYFTYYSDKFCYMGLLKRP